ncbi:MAG: DUF2057 family protein [Pseudomonadota bacterium]|jgi:hypothetical protein|uniref:DUF2057 family protein n=1 Tax=Halopseudomonas TaxID=2901189 RepID=UPI0022B6C4FF|nr:MULTISPECIES: DUF2057 family protein [Halopseudomonas]MEE2798008.1 DUF2057 family protein [Pseudomonadota bacterium]BDX20256.1 hypothetical protein MFKK_30660 [Halopseudomonas aestusnigri]
MRQLLCLAAAALLSACAQQAPVKLYSGAEQPASQVLVVEMPNTLEVLNINGQPAPEANRMVGNNLRQLELQPGKYRINAYFENGYDVGGGLSHEIVRTRSATFTIDGQAGELWRIEFDEPGNLKQAQEMENNFEGVAVNTRTGERVVSEPGPRYVSLLGEMFGSGTMVATRDHGIAPIGAAPQATAQVPMAVPTPSQAAAPAQTLPHDASTLATLKQIYLMLSPESRDAFLEWAAQ